MSTPTPICPEPTPTGSPVSTTAIPVLSPVLPPFTKSRHAKLASFRGVKNLINQCYRTHKIPNQFHLKKVPVKSESIKNSITDLQNNLGLILNISATDQESYENLVGEALKLRKAELPFAVFLYNTDTSEEGALLLRIYANLNDQNGSMRSYVITNDSITRPRLGYSMDRNMTISLERFLYRTYTDGLTFELLSQCLPLAGNSDHQTEEEFEEIEG